MAGQSRDLLALLSPPLCGMRCRLASVPPEIRKTMLLFIFLKEKKFPVCFSFILFKIGKKHLLCSHVSGGKKVSHGCTSLEIICLKVICKHLRKALLEQQFQLKISLKPYLCFAVVPEKKEEKATKAAEQGKKKIKHVGIIALKRQWHRNKKLRQLDDSNL